VRGQGVGKSLLDHLLARARASGCEVIHLDVRSDNAVALGLYESYGFTELGRRRGYYRGADAVVMRAFLTGGAPA
jgi:[ribosomal protein S18]-alanine N-acetyltransferase